MSSARDDFWIIGYGHAKMSKSSWGHSKSQISEPYARSTEPVPEVNSHDIEDEGEFKTIDEGVEEIIVTAPSEKYQHTNLTDPKSYIRLLKLQPSQKQELIVCELNEIGLEDSVERYDALSYVWGSPGNDSVKIQVNKGSLDIGPSLHCALKNLQYTDRPRSLWVDAICIDQTNDREKNYQVPLMREIYSNAACTVCFLGPEKMTTPALYDMLEKLAEERKLMALEGDWPGDRSTNALDTLPAVGNHLPIRPLSTDLSKRYVGDTTILAIADCPWWHRAWTVQELVLSPNAVMVTGRNSITFENLCAAVDHGLDTQIWGPVFLGFILNPIVVPYLSIKALMNHYRHPQHQRSPSVHLLHLLIHCRYRQSTNPRDKIYAVLGLLRQIFPDAMNPESPDPLNIELGYEKDVAYVYRSTCREIILKTGQLDILGVCPKSYLTGLPTWATDWSITDRIGTPLMQDSLDRVRTTHATKHTNLNARFSDDGEHMIISGQELTSVAALAKILVTPIQDRAVFRRFLEHEVYPTKYSSKFKPELKALSKSFEPALLRALSWWTSSPTHTPFPFLVDFQRNVGMYTIIACYILYYWLLFLLLLRKRLLLLWKRLLERWLILLTELKALGEALPEVYSIEFNSLSSFATLFAWESFAAAETSKNPGIDPDDVYWRTLCAGTYKNETLSQTREIYKHWFSLIQPLRTFLTYFPWFKEHFPRAGIAVYMYATWHTYGEFWPYITCAYERRIGRTENGWLCLLPRGARVGDVIVLVKGGRVPLLLRVEEGRRAFVGEVYVEGIMNGEAFKDGSCEDFEIW